MKPRYNIQPEFDFVEFANKIKGIGRVERFAVDTQCPYCISHRCEAIASCESRDVLAIICCACGHDF